MKRLVAALLGLSMAACIGCYAEAATLSKNANLRSDASTDAEIIVTLNAGDTVEILEYGDEWCHVNAGEAGEGYISTGLIADAAGDADSAASDTEDVKAQLESEIAQIDTQIAELQSQRDELAAELDAIPDETEAASNDAAVDTAETQKITFRNLEWYGTFKDIDAQLADEGITYSSWNVDDCVYRLSRVDFINVWDGSDYVEGAGLTIRYSGVEVAGYTPSDTYACYMYPIENNAIVRDDEQAQFYFAWYAFDDNDYKDIAGLYDDLYTKLQSIYGEGQTVEEYHTYILWTDSEGNRLKLISNDDRTYAMLGYMAAGGDEKVDALEELVTAEAVAGEQAAREENASNTGGL